jgi:hypothetical protein
MPLLDGILRLFFLIMMLLSVLVFGKLVEDGRDDWRDDWRVDRREEGRRMD